MNVELERKLLLKEIAVLSHAVVSDDEGFTLFDQSELKSLETEDVEGLRALRNRLGVLARSVGGARKR